MAETTRERPILFSASMVRALLDGRKTQTRRAVKPQPVACDHASFKTLGACWWDKPTKFYEMMAGQWSCELCGNGTKLDHVRRDVKAIRCPYGAVGDRLWVRESHAIKGKAVAYMADFERIAGTGGWGHRERLSVFAGDKWKPSIHMPRWASRLTLEITGVRVERVQSISAADCVAEGMAPTMRNEPPVKERFADLWDEINGDGSWAANPWVWAIAFRRLNPEPRR